jgi:hypothetical protein
VTVTADVHSNDELVATVLAQLVIRGQE